MAQRAGATITEVEGSHVIMISQPQAVTDVIRQAIDSLSAVSVRGKRRGGRPVCGAGGACDACGVSLPCPGVAQPGAVTALMDHQCCSRDIDGASMSFAGAG
jgi:hypothetical protein